MNKIKMVIDDKQKQLGENKMAFCTKCLEEKNRDGIELKEDILTHTKYWSCLKCNGKCKIELTFTPAKKEGIGIGMRDNGLKYSRRNDVNRYFYPIEWENFLSVIKPKKRLLFIFLLNTGARINEARHVKKRDIDFQRSNVVLIVTKVKARKKERGSKPRRIRISSALTKKLKTACRGLREDEFIFQGNINDKPINKNAVWKMMRKGLKDAGIKDDYNFGLHNIRKTCGNWLTALGVSINEVCSRLGHDIATYQKHYGSPSLFQQKDREMMIKFLGDTYEWKTQQTL